MARHGYQSCSSCHVSPSGGGALSAYGRSLSSELLSTWGSTEETDPGHTPWLPEWLAIGGDARYVNLATRYNEVTTYRSIPMQKDIELGINCGPLWLVTSYGEYFETTETPYQLRRAYLLLGSDTLGVSLRLGKFGVNYGLNHPDHTAYNRGVLNLGQGKESLNVELNLTNKIGMLTATAILGDESSLISLYRAPKITSGARQGGALRLITYPHERISIGASWMYTHIDYEQDLYVSGVFANLSLNEWIYGMVDYNFQEIAGGDDMATLWAKVGLEALKGLHFFYSINMLNEITANGLGIIWYPRPHFEILTQAQMSGEILNYLLMTHYYL